MKTWTLLSLFTLAMLLAVAGNNVAIFATMPLILINVAYYLSGECQ